MKMILFQKGLEGKPLVQSTLSKYETISWAPGIARHHTEKATPSKKALMNWSEIPEWMRFNRYVLTGYRPPSGSFPSCIRSIAEIHNESMNIWTHLFGVAFTMLLFIHYLSDDKWNYLSRASYAPLSVYFICCICCLACSSVFHTFASHSKEVAATCHCIDYAGIILQGTGSWLPSLYYYFYCEPELQFFYTVVIIVGAIATGGLMTIPQFRAPKYLWIRTAVFLVFGLSGVVALFHSAILHGLPTLFDMGFGHILTVSLLYVVGTLIFAARIPERWYPEKFDIWFQSHSIFHTAVVAAIICYYFSMVQAHNYWVSREAGNLYCTPSMLA
ncbi:hemolysin-III related-domain-containing protein [Fennellomyces sp. T-0311]|nr:hemolysin-III related-domain-containing protein [Fennellomyces sp. T-0311]